MNLPKYTATNSLHNSSIVCHQDEITNSNSDRIIIPQMMRTWTVHHGLAAVYLEYACARLGGGMSSNADGSVTCTFDA